MNLSMDKCDLQSQAFGSQTEHEKVWASISGFKRCSDLCLNSYSHDILCSLIAEIDHEYDFKPL
jgi:hypothetical protein